MLIPRNALGWRVVARRFLKPLAQDQKESEPPTDHRQPFEYLSALAGHLYYRMACQKHVNDQRRKMQHGHEQIRNILLKIAVLYGLPKHFLRAMSFIFYGGI